MQIVRAPPGNMSQIIQDGECLADPDRGMGIDGLSEEYKPSFFLPSFLPSFLSFLFPSFLDAAGL